MPDKTDQAQRPPSAPTSTRLRGVEKLVVGQATSDGAGVKLTRVLTHELQRRLDPFLMLDNFASDDPQDYIAGFPDHPHRGFETITYMIAGRMRHRDSAGHEGLLQSGGVQWMTAGSGLIHSEMPEQEDGVMEGFQLWLNLPGRDKMCPPAYRDFASPEIPEITSPEGVLIRVISGTSHGVSGAMHRPDSEFPTSPLYLDIHFPAGATTLTHELPQDLNAFLYTYRGTVHVISDDGTATAVPQQHMALLDNSGRALRMEVRPGQQAVRALLIAGRPLNEPIAQYGPFVMNTREELLTAVHDFQSGRLG
ncbi:MAG: pirin family protein [Hylemonella sp.]|nr:pirin family protein [Hylemonella sp.]